MRRLIRGLLFAFPIPMTMACAGRSSFSESEHPPSGRYRVTTVTRDDTCMPETSQGIFEDLVASSDEALNVPVWATFRADLLWTNTQRLEMKLCPFEKAVPSSPVLRAVYDIRKLTIDSFELVSTWHWDDPSACPNAEGARLPSAPCSLERTESFELLQACSVTSHLTCSEPPI